MVLFRSLHVRRNSTQTNSTPLRLAENLRTKSSELVTFGERLSEKHAEGVLKGFKHKLLASANTCTSPTLALLVRKVWARHPCLRDQKAVNDMLEQGRELLPN